VAEPREDFIFLQSLEPVVTGQESERLPPHLTTLSWFSIERSRIEGVKPLLDELAHEYRFEAPKAVGFERVMFGEKENIPACRVLIGTFAIHDTLLKWVDENGGEFKNEKFARTYHPHITDEQGVSVQPGDPINLSSLAVYSHQNTPTQKRKVAEYSVPLGKKIL
jgi:hypothetical protein